jgi:hypothetical protein
VRVPEELELLVLACLEKEPARRPQSADELRRRLQACAVEPWESADAQTWWLEHQSALAGDALESPGEARTLAVDGSRAL